jgi:hypothetical protein
MGREAYGPLGGDVVDRERVRKPFSGIIEQALMCYGCGAAAGLGLLRARRYGL